MGEISRGEQGVIDDLNEFVRQSANLQSEVPETSGIRPHPLVESTEQTLDTSRFGFGFGPKPLSIVEPESGSQPPSVTCCPTATLVCDQITDTETKCLTSFDAFFNPDDGNCYAKINSCDGDVYTDQVPCFRKWLTSNLDCCDGSHCEVSTCNPDTCEATVGPNTCAECTEGEAGGGSISDEFTTEALIAKTVANLPGYSGEFSPCGADDAIISKIELDGPVVGFGEADTCIIQRSRFKWTWESPLEADCKICWIERTMDSDGNIVSDTRVCETVLAGETESSVHELLEPDPVECTTTGCTTFKIILYPLGGCCVSGVCTTVDLGTCNAHGGTFHANPCADDPCSPSPC